MNAIKKPWILVGYTLFAQEGPTGIKVETIAKLVNKNKSSFYHHFAEREIFIESLLDYHLERAKIMAKEESHCKNVVPELCNVLLTFKEDLLFNRQLRIHRDNPQFKACFEKTTQEIAAAIMDIWATGLGLSNHSGLAQIVLNLSMDNFYLQITEDTLTYEWLTGYFEELKNMVKAFQHTKNIKR